MVKEFKKHVQGGWKGRRKVQCVMCDKRISVIMKERVFKIEVSDAACF